MIWFGALLTTAVGHVVGTEIYTILAANSGASQI